MSIKYEGGAICNMFAELTHRDNVVIEADHVESKLSDELHCIIIGVMCVAAVVGFIIVTVTAIS